MNEFDLQLECELRRFLDPIAAAPAPARRTKRGDPGPIVKLTVLTPENLAAIPVEAFS